MLVVLAGSVFVIVNLFPLLFYRTLNTESYLTFHNLAELLSIIVSFSIFGVGYFTHKQSKNSYALFLSCAFLVIGSIDLMHTLSFPGMPAFITESSTNKAILFWISARLVSAFAFILSAFLVIKTVKSGLKREYLIPIVLFIITLVFVLVIYYPSHLPVMFVEGQGLTSTKVYLEYVVIVLFALASIIYWWCFSKTRKKFIILILGALVLSIFSELAFTYYKSAFDSFNLLGHIYKIMAFSMIYAGIFLVAVSQPYKDLEKEVHERRKAENALIESRNHLDNIINSIADPVFVKDEKHRWVLLNNKYCEFMGYSRSELIGKSDYDFFPKSQADVFWKIDGEVLKTGIANENEEEFTDSKGNLHTTIAKKTLFIDELGNKYIVGVIRDITERKKAEKEIINSLKEKEILIQEIHHRVKNNMQIITSLLNLQTRFVEEEETKDVLKDSQGWVKSMAMIHERLYQSPDLSHINFREYVEKLVSNIFYTYGIIKNTIQPILHVDDIEMNMETAIPLGLIINELVTNSLKFAFPERGEGSITVRIKAKDHEYVLTVADDGIGLPEDIDIETTETLGLQLVHTLINQLDGTIKVDRSHGTKFTIKFKELKYKERI